MQEKLSFVSLFGPISSAHKGMIRIQDSQDSFLNGCDIGNSIFPSVVDKYVIHLGMRVHINLRSAKLCCIQIPICSKERRGLVKPSIHRNHFTR